MRRPIFIALAFWLAAAAAAAAVPPGSIAVVGSAETHVKPDGVVWKLTIFTRDRDLAKAKERNDRKLDAVAAATINLGIPSDHVEVGEVLVRQVYEGSSLRRSNKFQHFELQRVVIVRQDEIAHYEAYLEELAVDPGITAATRWTYSDYEAQLAALRMQALQHAMDKADALATLAGAAVGAPRTISEYKPTASAQEITNEHALAREPRWNSARFSAPETIRLYVRIFATFALEVPDVASVPEVTP